MLSGVKMKKVNILFAVILALYFLAILAQFFVVPRGASPLFKNLMLSALGLFVLFAYVHAIYTLKKKAIIFIILAFLIMWFGEWMTTRIISDYYTLFLPGPRLFGKIPLVIPIAWFARLYIAYSVINYIFGRERRNLPLLVILILSCCYGLSTMAMDMGREIIYSIHLHIWTWPEAGAYFGTPLFNLHSYFAHAFVVTFIFLFYESRISMENKSKADFFPVIAYFLFLLNITSEAFVVGHREFAMIQAGCMLPFVAIALLAAVRKRNGEKAVETSGDN